MREMGYKGMGEIWVCQYDGRYFLAWNGEGMGEWEEKM